MTTQSESEIAQLPAGLIVFSASGAAQFGWQNPETGEYFAESDGRCITDAIGAIAWDSDRVH